jgi:hypothetical protein
MTPIPKEFPDDPRELYLNEKKPKRRDCIPIAIGMEDAKCNDSHKHHHREDNNVVDVHCVEDEPLNFEGRSRLSPWVLEGLKEVESRHDKILDVEEEPYELSYDADWECKIYYGFTQHWRNDAS